MTGEGRRLAASSPSALEALVREIARQAAREAVREALRDAPGPNPRYTTIAAYARSQNLGTSTLRRWAKAAGVERQENGRYLSSELEAAIAGAGKARVVVREPTPAPAAPVDLAAERGRRAAAELVGARRPR